jgi:hypothetical protein
VPPGPDLGGAAGPMCGVCTAAPCVESAHPQGRAEAALAAWRHGVKASATVGHGNPAAKASWQ